VINFLCPNCKKSLKAKDEDEGKKVKCNKCGELLTVPALADREPVVLMQSTEPVVEDSKAIEEPPKKAWQKAFADELSPKKTATKESLSSKFFRFIFVTMLIAGGTYCCIKWLYFLSAVDKHKTYIHTQENITIGESSFGTYHILSEMAEPLVLTIFWAIFFLVGQMKRAK